jgi:hypothetical protein
MFANPKTSGVILLNVARVAGRSDALATRRLGSLSILAEAAARHAVEPLVVGECAGPHVPATLIASAVAFDGDKSDLWQSQNIPALLPSPDVGTVYLGGAWLEEDVLFACIRGVEIGYDVRVLIDLCDAQHPLERCPALQRLAQHTVLITTVRQMLCEWTLSRQVAG